MPKPRLIRAHGKVQSLGAWSRELGIPRDTIGSRLDRGVPPVEALKPATAPAVSKIVKGSVVGEWTVLSELPKRDRDRYFSCRCSCGAQKEVRGSNLVSGLSRSCGHQMLAHHRKIMGVVFEKD